MTKNQSFAKKIEAGLYTAARGVSKLSYPLSWEKLEIDENRSLWASYTPEYQLNAPLNGTISADLCIIGGGYTGISTAYHFSHHYPDKKVVLIEAKALAN
ncbi:MAG: FAD-dependent oxidoreductase, partial [Chloroflexota bacterium]